MDIKQASILELMKEIKRKCEAIEKPEDMQFCKDCSANDECDAYFYRSPFDWDLEGLDD